MFTDKGELFGWGNSEYGQIPMATTQHQVNTPYALLNFTRGLGRIVDIAAGGSFCMIVNGWNYNISPFNSLRMSVCQSIHRRVDGPPNVTYALDILN